MLTLSGQISSTKDLRILAGHLHIESDEVSRNLRNYITKAAFHTLCPWFAEQSDSRSAYIAMDEALRHAKMPGLLSQIR